MILSSDTTINKVILFTDKEKAPLMLRGLSNYFAERIKFGFVNIDDTAVLRQFEVSTFPKIMVYQTNEDLLRLDESKQIYYDGELKIKEIVKFLTPFCLHTQLSTMNEKINEDRDFFSNYLPEETVETSHFDAKMAELKDKRVLVFFGKGDLPENVHKLGVKSKFLVNLADSSSF